MTVAQKNRLFFSCLIGIAIIMALSPASANAPTMDTAIELCPDA
jgi:hypothetical protein